VEKNCFYQYFSRNPSDEYLFNDKEDNEQEYIYTISQK
jgi:hypothetical protein